MSALIVDPAAAAPAVALALVLVGATMRHACDPALPGRRRGRAGRHRRSLWPTPAPAPARAAGRHAHTDTAGVPVAYLIEHTRETDAAALLTGVPVIDLGSVTHPRYPAHTGGIR